MSIPALKNEIMQKVRNPGRRKLFFHCANCGV